MTTLFLITGIPGTGKTTVADTLAKNLGFVHCDLEKQETLDRLAANPTQFIADIVSQNRDNVVTWGFVPDDPASVSAPKIVQARITRQTLTRGFTKLQKTLELAG